MTLPVLALLLIKVSLVLSVALLGAHWLRGATAINRHRLWSTAFGAVLVLPILALVLPAIEMPMPGWVAHTTAPATVQPDVEPPVPDSRIDSPVFSNSQTAEPIHVPDALQASVPAALSRLSSFGMSLAILWVLGAAAAAGGLLLSLVRVSRVTRDARELAEPAWREAVDRIATRVGLRRRARVLMSDRVTTPMAGGVARPSVFVPRSASMWPSDLREVVLAHELSHLASRDPLRQIVARLACSLYWFHPLVWYAARQAAVAREQACDEAVLALGTRPSTYARVLLGFADGIPPHAAGCAALPIVQRTLLEKRLMAILDDDARPAARRRVFVPVFGVVVLTLSVAAAQPAPAGAVIAEEQGQAAGAGVGAGVGSGVGAGAGISSSATGGGAAAGVPGGVARGVTGAVGGVPEYVDQSGRVDSACDREWGTSFNGSISMGERNGRTVIYDQVGWRGDDLIVQKRFGDIRVCAIAEGLGRDARSRPRQWAAGARRLILETEERGETRRMEMASGGQVVRWQVNGVERPADAAATEWADRLVALIEPAWELSMLRGQESSLRGQISSVQGQRSSLQGEISSLQGQVSSMRGRISSIQGEESSLRGQISSIQGHLSSLQGAISSQQGAISSLRASRWDSEAARQGKIEERIREHEKAIVRLEAEIKTYNADALIKDVERELAKVATGARVAEIEKQIREFDLEGKIAQVEKRVAELDVSGRTAAIEREIAELQVERRSRDLAAQVDAALKALERALAQIR